MTEEEKKARIKHLWSLVRKSVRARSIMKFVIKEEKKGGMDNLGLDSSVDYELSESQQLEEELVYEDDGGFNDLAWYLVNPESNLSKFQNVQVQMMTWCTLILTPLLILFKESEPRPGSYEVHMDPSTLKSLEIVEWLVDISWSIEIILNFITADSNNRKFKTIAKDYISCWFWIDALATFPALILLQ